MITFKQGDIFESKAQTLVNTVNCVGVMGKGLAKEFKDRFPEMERQYVSACRRGDVRSGRPFVYRDLTHIILCFPTKDNWKGPSKYEFIEAGLKAIVEKYQEWGIQSMAIPPLGCGLGGLDWSKVRNLIETYLGPLPIEIEVFEPGPVGAKLTKPAGKKVVERVHITEALSLVGELVMLARKRMSSTKPLGRLLVQKLAYFAQSAGVPLKLKFDKHKYGPYDHNLNHMIERLEGLYIRDTSPSYERSNLQILDEVAWVKESATWSESKLSSGPALERAVHMLASRELLEAELLATTLYAWNTLVSSGDLGTADEVVDFIHRWSQEKREKFTAADITSALDALAKDGWFGPQGPPTGLASPSRGMVELVP